MRFSRSFVLSGASLLVFAYFLAFFDEARWQPSVDAAWLLGSLLWLVAWWPPGEKSPHGRLSHPWWFYALYVAALVPFGTNWRWSMTGDNLGWPLGGLHLAERGPFKSFLSLYGADNFGYLQMVLHNAFMHLVEPTLFWHRVGKVFVGVLALASVYAVFARLVSRPFGLLVAGASATTSIWIVYTYASVPFMDGIASGYAAIALGLWIEREPRSRRAWLLLGALSGFMLFLTPNGWYLAACVWAWLGWGVLRGRYEPRDFVLAASTGLLVATPVFVQWATGRGDRLFSLVENPNWSWAKILRFFREALSLPFQSEIQSAGAFGPQLPPGFRWLFVPGVAAALVFGKYLPGGYRILALYAVQVVALVFSQGPYANVSVKRALHLIPMATYFAFLPFHRWLSSTKVVLPVLAVWASFGISDVVFRMQPGRTGYTMLDGIIEAHQRFAPAEVCLYLTDDRFAGVLDPSHPVNRLYGLSPRVRRTKDLDPGSCREVLCYSPQIDELALEELGYREVRLLNSVELRCGLGPEFPGSPLDKGEKTWLGALDRAIARIRGTKREAEEGG
ncbi:MAG: hypothetical protein KatS3mg076_0509 [Candidatus Binatia bacterium]|nr:MAG: hypothetical protein KatS3mg076_0509 [Candidatus Binatia bacterium]